jgi:hypothetical protein
MKWNGNIASSFASGDGSNKNPYQIATGEELAYLAKQIIMKQTFIEKSSF